jgi:hypothetical protein
MKRSTTKIKKERREHHFILLIGSNGVVLNKQMNSAFVLAKNKKNRATSSHLDKPSQKGKMANKKIKKMARGREPTS